MTFATSQELQELVDSIAAIHERAQEMIVQHQKETSGNMQGTSTYLALAAAANGLNDARFALNTLKKGRVESEEKSRRAAMSTLASLSNN
jgi:hypothetical protein